MAITIDDKGDIKYIPSTPGTQNFGFIVGGGSMPGFSIPIPPGQSPSANNPSGGPSGPGSNGPGGSPSGPGGTNQAPGLDPTIRAYMDTAAIYGYDFTMSQYQALLNGRVSPSDFAARLAIVKRTQDQKALLDAFGQVLFARGLVKDPNLTLQERLAFVSGKAPATWMGVMDEFNVWADAINAGLNPQGTGTYGISRQELLNISKRMPGIGGEGQLIDAFTKVAQDFKYAIPMGRWTGFGISKSDVIAAELGSDKPGYQVAVIDKMQRALATYSAAQQNRANPQFAVTANGGAVFGYGGLGGGGSQ